MDILLNGANAALHLAHDLRRDVEVGLLLLGPPHPPRFVRLEGFGLRNYQPDIRSNAALLRRLLVDTSRMPGHLAHGELASQMSREEPHARLGRPFVYAQHAVTHLRPATLPVVQR